MKVITMEGVSVWKERVEMYDGAAKLVHDGTTY